MDLAGPSSPPTDEQLEKMPDPSSPTFSEAPRHFYQEHPNNPFGFLISSPFPRKVFRDLSKTVEECGWCPGLNLMVEEDDQESISSFSGTL
jgi:hypothetical protein